jgi:nitrogenase subunit NifH
MAITTEIKASLVTIGTKFAVKFEMDITDHMAREITYAIAELFSDTPDSGEIIRTEKAKTSLKRQKGDSDQADLFRDQYEQVKPTESEMKPAGQPEQITFTNAAMIELAPPDEPEDGE